MREEIRSASNQHLAIGQPNRGVAPTNGWHGARGRPRSRCVRVGADGVEDGCQTGCNGKQQVQLLFFPGELNEVSFYEAEPRWMIGIFHVCFSLRTDRVACFSIGDKPCSTAFN